VKKSRDVVETVGRCGENVVLLLSSYRLRSDILSVKTEAMLSASEIPGVKEGNSEGDLGRSSLLTVCQSHLGLPEDEEMRLE